MNKRERITLGMSWRLIALAALVVALGLGVHPIAGWAVVNCTTVTADSLTDSDNDGFTDFQECAGIATAGASSISFPWCGSSAPRSRDQCVDPDSKDLFVIYAPATSGSLLPVDFAPFGNVTAYGITFIGLSALVGAK